MVNTCGAVLARVRKAVVYVFFTILSLKAFGADADVVVDLEYVNVDLDTWTCPC